MNKQEAIKKVEQMGEYERFVNESIPKLSILNILNQLDEPQKVTLPRPVANWISCVRGRNKTLHFALENAPEEVNLWFCEDEKNRQNVFADAWVNGYHIEKEKRYIVKVKGVEARSQWDEEITLVRFGGNGCLKLKIKKIELREKRKNEYCISFEKR